MYKISYFNNKGRITAIIAALDIAQVPYEVEVIQPEDFILYKGNIARFPLGQLPVLTLPSGKVITQSVAILRYVGKLAQLYPIDFEQALYVDEIMDVCSELIASAPQCSDEATKKILRIKWTNGKLSTNLEFLASKITPNKFLVGDTLSVADLFVYSVIVIFRIGTFDYVPTDIDTICPILGEYYDFILSSIKSIKVQR